MLREVCSLLTRRKELRVIMIKRALASCSPWLAAFGLVFACWGVTDVEAKGSADRPNDDMEDIGAPCAGGQSTVGAPSVGHVTRLTMVRMDHRRSG
jgi:hypothetical protein